MVANNHARRKKREHHHRYKENDVARIKHAALKVFKMRHHAECRHRAHQPAAFGNRFQQFRHRRPASISSKQSTTETIKLTTWLRVIADVMQLIARYAPAIKKLPTYPANAIPLSGFPK